MAHFAQLDQNNIVMQVIVVDNENLLDRNGKEREWIGIRYCQSIFGNQTRWVQTSYNGRIRSIYAVVGGYYDEANDRFLPIKPYEKWILNEQGTGYEPPIPQPTRKVWDEARGEWVERPDSGYVWSDDKELWEKI